MSRLGFSLTSLCALLLACPSSEPPVVPPPCEAVAGRAALGTDGVMDPFPSFHVMAMTGDGCRVRVPEAAMPAVIDGSPLPTSRFDVRDGFSAGQTAIWRSGVAVDPGSLPRWDDVDGGLGANDSVQLWDVDAGVRLPAFAEVDAYPEQADDDRALLVRPLAPLPFGARVAVVVTDRVRTRAGGTLEAPAGFAEIRDAEDPGDDPVTLHYDALLVRLAELGVPREGVVMAWDFPVGTHANIAAPLDAVLAQMRDDLPVDEAHEPSVSVDALLDRDNGDTPASGLWRELRGSFQLTHHLWVDDDAAPDEEHDGGAFRVDADGRPIPRGEAPAFFVAVVPESVRDAAPGTVPVVVFGHGIFSAPAEYLAAPNDPNATVELLDRMGAIGIGGEWRGLTERDRPDAIRVAVDIGQFPLLTDKLVQGVSNQIALPRLMRSTFRDHEAFQDGNGDSYIDPSRMYYFGISLGGIEGLTLLAHSEVVEHGVTHVPGSLWSTMLERSTNWNAFEPFVIDHVPTASDRQLIYAASQLLWDPVDPVTHHRDLGGKSVLMQVSIGDEQVPNFTAEVMARGARFPAVSPSVTEPAGLSTLPVPSSPGASGYMEFDLVTEPVPEVNRPAEGATGAHTGIRGTDEVITQVVGFFSEGAEGTITHPCGTEPCILD